MTSQVSNRTKPAAARWYALSPEDVAGQLGVDVAGGLSAAKAAERLQENGPNALPAEKTVPGWRRFVEQYRSYMQIILLIAAVVSFAIGQWSTGAVLVSLTVLNAMVGLRQEGKAESAMNALKSLTKRIARVRRDGAEAQIPAEQVVIGDLVLLSAGDDVAADGRIISASSLDIDESALTGESTPASKTTEPLADADLGPGDQTNMAFMNTPVTHGSGVMLVTAVGADAQVGKIAGMLATTAKQQTPLTQAVEHIDPLDRRGRAGHDDRDVRAWPVPRPARRGAVHHRDRVGNRRHTYGVALQLGHRLLRR
jgi:Ca2+-transporting ATPase